ncbi:MAG: penicillin-binding protein, partial [Actinomycetota bacterium]|nr:penicillin-binding protein [Actinomycetota bacterium]
MPRPRSERLSAPRVLSHLAVMLVVSVILGVVVSGLAIPFAGVLGFTTKNVAETMDDLPTVLETDNLPQRTRIVDAKGETIAQLYDQNRINVSLRNISRTMVKAILAIEDYRFYEHGALDVKGTIRAFLTNAASDDVVQGGSSITQQLVKLTLLNQAKTKAEQEAVTDDSYARKLRELRYAIALEQEYSKDWILERYLNTAYFGDGAYGIQAAARHYYDVNAKQLKLNQSATLAGLVQNPKYDPVDYRERATSRRNVVLDRMAELNVIPERTAESVKAQPLKLDPQPSDNGCVNSQAPFFCDYVVRYLMEDRRLGKTEKIRKEVLYTGGLTIRTTIDLDYQEYADDAVENHVDARDNAIGALALVEPGTGQVKAIAQSRPMGAAKNQGQTYLNYTVPSEYGDANGFQAGSTFKVFVLAAAIEQGIPLNHVISAPADMVLQESSYRTCGGETYGYGTWPVGNYDDTSHTANLYSGTRDSINTFFAQLEQQTGLCAPYDLAKKMGVRLTNPTGPGAERIPSFTLGVADVSPLEMAEAYATFAARGLHCTARPVLEIRDARRNVIREYPEECEQVIEQTTADAVNDILRGVIEGGFASAQALDQPAAGKTGTTNGGKSVWFVGYTPSMAAAAMIAGANRLGTPIGLDGQTIGGVYRTGASGSAFAAPIWGDAMKLVDDDLEWADFIYPSTVPGAGTTFVAPP